MPPSNLTNNERAYYLAPRNETFRKNPPAYYRYLHYKASGKKYEKEYPNAPIVNYGPLAKKMNAMTNAVKTRKNRRANRKTRRNRRS